MAILSLCARAHVYIYTRIICIRIYMRARPPTMRQSFLCSLSVCSARVSVQWGIESSSVDLSFVLSFGELKRPSR